MDSKELIQLWQDAYRANPGVYEKADSGILVSFALTEDTPSLFPSCLRNNGHCRGKPSACG